MVQNGIMSSNIFNVHIQDKIREICTASCFMGVKGDSLDGQHKHCVDDGFVTFKV